MDNVKKAADPRIEIVAALWPTHHPRDIADRVNTRYGYEGRSRWTEHHVCNARQILAGLDRLSPSR